ncbi:glycoside hydrolase family 32 protein [Acetobacter conturbans]|uniref:Levanase n=1 Tax=Acetobacter conturbans TaxID=1737472 RepID=A0ABX0JZE9_9PROT|nr:glycoside hydrolase family 32 protein [Acetobacter conturbans]NHN88234.1 hypothetical protein [Acetobacter conturbans]
MSATPFLNDPQVPFLRNGLWHLYYLWNGDYPNSPGGTAWRHAVSPDLLNWWDQGVAIEKFTTSQGDIWSGTPVVDTYNTAGFGAGAVIALLTMPMTGDEGQSTARWVSTDGGYTFSFDRIVMTNPQAGTDSDSKDFRDPRLLWMTNERYWVMVLGEGNKIGFYRSANLADWTYMSGFMCDTLGLLECPSLFPMVQHDENGTAIGTKWILLCSANGYQTGFTTGAYYWTGSFDGTTFIADNQAGQWLDGGSDFYATAIWGPKATTSTPQITCYAIAWMNNWAYATLVTKAGYYGRMSKVRKLTLKTVSGRARLSNDFYTLTGSSSFAYTVAKKQTLTPLSPVKIPTVSRGSYRIDATLSAASGSWPSEIVVLLQSGAGTPIRLILSPQSGNVNLQRTQSGFTPATTDPAWASDRNAPLTFGQSISFSARINPDGLEIVFNQGALSLTSLVFPTTTAGAASITTSGGGVLRADIKLYRV